MTQNDFNTEVAAAEKQEMLKIHRRCNDAELERLKRSFDQAVEVIKQLNQQPAVQLSTVKFAIDPIPDSRGCAVRVDMFVYVPPNEEAK